ncbi:TIGR03364 family FAD-dependent oxidoreductase [Microbacterium sp. ZW T2_14]|uniref:TIGR03364 family FAD-dependent oxidoreductase n=1 Tax=Microbacterium sp. ZW T2_14 TaxID=3378079 RepID=UPI003854FFDA
MNRGFDVAVVGAGIVGLGAAYAAVRRGQRVVVIERAPEALGATVRNFGHLCIGAQTGRAREYADASRPLWLRLAQDAGFWLRESGTLVVARHTDELALLEAAALAGGIELLDGAELDQRVSLRRGVAVGGAWIRPDLQTNPRTAAAAIRAHLEALGVEFRTRTSVGAVETGRVHTTRGPIHAGLVIVAVNHDLDQLLPDLAERVGVVRCGLDMLRVRGGAASVTAPLLTGWSLVRYGRFAALPEATAVRERLHAERPDLAALDLNQMYTQLPDGSVIVGDTHYKAVGIAPFQPEAAADLLLEEFETLFGTRPSVLERWQGVYASGPDEFLVAEPEPGVLALAATTGIGMTTGLGLAETVLTPLLGVDAELSTPEGIRP